MHNIAYYELGVHNIIRRLLTVDAMLRTSDRNQKELTASDNGFPV